MMKKELVSANMVLLHDDSCNLSYFISETPDLHYGISVRKETSHGDFEEEYAERLSTCKEEIYSLVLKLSEHTVTPMALYDIVYDYFISKLINTNKIIFTNKFCYESNRMKCV